MLRDSKSSSQLDLDFEEPLLVDSVFLVGRSGYKLLGAIKRQKCVTGISNKTPDIAR